MKEEEEEEEEEEESVKVMRVKLMSKFWKVVVPWLACVRVTRRVGGGGGGGGGGATALPGTVPTEGAAADRPHPNRAARMADAAEHVLPVHALGASGLLAVAYRRRELAKPTGGKEKKKKRIHNAPKKTKKKCASQNNRARMGTR